MRKRYVVFGIFLIIIIIISIPISYFVAYGVVSDAVFRLGFTYSGSIDKELKGISFAGEFTFENGAIIPLTIDVVNISIFVYNSSSHYDSHLYFTGPPRVPDAIDIGDVVSENKIVPPNGQVTISANFDVTSEDALNLIHGGNYSVGGSYRELTVSGSFLFWHFTPQIAFQ